MLRDYFWILLWIGNIAGQEPDPNCVKIKYAFSKQLSLDAANGEGQIFLVTNKNQLLVLGGDGQTIDNGPLLEVEYSENFNSLPSNLTSIVRNPKVPDSYYGFSGCTLNELKFNREKTVFEVTDNNLWMTGNYSKFNLQLPCPLDAAVIFKQNIFAFRGCKLWNQNGEVIHLHQIGLPCNIDTAFTVKDKSARSGRTIVKIYVIKDNRFWSTTVKVKDDYPNFKESQIGNINFDLDICSISMCEKAMYTGRYGHLYDSDIYDPYDVQELFSGDESELDYNYEDEEHVGPVGIYGPKISEHKLFLEQHLYKKIQPKMHRCNGDDRFCRLKYDQITFPGTHNSASGADFRFREDDFTERCNIADQTTSLDQQLQEGIRYFEFSPCKKGCPLYKSLRAARNRVFSPFKSFHSPVFSRRKSKSAQDEKISQYSNWPGFCTKNRCTMPLCRAIKIFKRWNSQNPTEVVTLHFGPENNGGSETGTLSAENWESYLKFLTRYLERQFPTQLNSYRIERGEWPYIETLKPIFIFINDRDIVGSNKANAHLDNYKWIHRQSSFLATTHMARGVTGTCEHVIVDSGVQCRLKPMYELLNLAVYGTYGLCTIDRARYCNQYLFESSDQCLKYRSEFGKTINYITTDHTNDKTRYPESAISAAYHTNLYNLLQFHPNTCKASSPDAAMRWPGDQRIYFFKNHKIHRYEETAQTVDHIFDLKIKDLDNIDAAITINTTTLLFKDCHLWEYKVSYYGEAKEPKWHLSKKIDLATRYPGLPCNLDAAFSMYGRQYFFKGCLYYEVYETKDNQNMNPNSGASSNSNSAQNPEHWKMGHETGYIVDDEHMTVRGPSVLHQNSQENSNPKAKLQVDLTDKDINGQLPISDNNKFDLKTEKPDIFENVDPTFNYNKYFVSRAQDIYDWGLPCDIDAVLAWNSWTSYFFKDGYYFRWHENKLSNARSLMHWNIDMVECE